MTGCTAYEEDEAIATNSTARQQFTERNQVVKLPTHPPGDMHNAYVDEKGISYTVYQSNPLHAAIDTENDSQKKRQLIMNNYDLKFDIQTGKLL